MLEQIVGLVARDFKTRLEEEPSFTPESFARRQVLDFAPSMDIYVIGPDGHDVLGRTVPDVVTRAITDGTNPDGRAARQVYLQKNGLNGHTIAGLASYFPLSQVLSKPGARALMITVLIVISAAVSFLLARFIVLPVRRLQSAGQKVAAGDLSVRLAPTVGSRTDDIARLTRDFDVMTERVDALLKSQQRLMRDVSHELRSPLARLQALFSIVRQGAESTDLPHLDRMENELERLDELIGEILVYARLEARQSVSRHPTDIVDLVQNIVDDASLEGQASDKHIELTAPDRVVTNVDSGLVHSAVENVIRNAIRYSPEGKPVEVEITEQTDRVVITVDDYGPGVPDDALDQIFEPFFRVDQSRSTHSGSGGIGLSIAERSIRLHGGTIVARHREGSGLQIEIELPVERQ